MNEELVKLAEATLKLMLETIKRMTSEGKDAASIKTMTEGSSIMAGILHSLKNAK